MKKEELEKLELDEKQIKAVQKIHGIDIEAHKSEIKTLETNITTLTSESATLTEQLTKAGETIEGLQGVDEEGLKKAAADYKAQAETAAAELEQSKTDAKAEMDKFKFDGKLSKSLVSEYGVKEKYVSDVTNRLKRETITLTDEGFVGLKEQVDPMKENLADLFTSSDEKPKFTTKAKSKTVVGDPLMNSIMEGAKIKPTEG